MMRKKPANLNKDYFVELVELSDCETFADSTTTLTVWRPIRVEKFSFLPELFAKLCTNCSTGQTGIG